jgi:hypothetical protein
MEENQIGRYVYVRNKKTGPGDGNMWPERKKAEAVKTWLATGNLTLTAAMINVPHTTLKLWRQSDWWQEMLENLREQDNIELDSKLTKILEKSMEAMEDRIKDGDYEFDRKTGSLRRVPVKLKDVHKVTSDLIDKRQVLRKQPTSITEQQTTTDDRLLKLAEQFAAMAGILREEKVVQHVVEGEFEELPEEYKDALHGKREEIVQEGASLGEAQSSEPGEGQSSPEQSPSDGS